VARGAQVKLDILRWDEVDLTIEARLLEVAAVPEAGADLDFEEEEEETGADSGQAAVQEAVEAEGVVAVVTPQPEGG
jgi:exoribonuclease II